jgi:lipid-A-disaccharide synthase
VPRTILISAGEASGDLYAALLAAELRRLWPDARLFGCTGPRMRQAGVESVVDSASLAVVGLLEVVAHIPRIYGEYRKLVAEVRRRRPDFAILTDSPDFHLRLARKLKQFGVPVVYLVAPQAWAWRKGRLPGMRRTLDRLLCIFPFEEQFFCSHRIKASYIGHPLAGLVRPALSRADFFRKHRLPLERPLVTVLPGSRRGEAARHLPHLLDAVDRLYREQAASFLLPASVTTGVEYFRDRMAGAPIKVIEGETWDAIAHADLALAASGTVTVEAALLGTPMVTFYRVTWPSWVLGKLLVKVPFYSMVNLVAGRAVVPELMQTEMTGARLAAEASRLLRDPAACQRMREELADVAAHLASAPGESGSVMRRAAAVIQDLMEGQVAHVS